MGSTNSKEFYYAVQSCLGSSGFQTVKTFPTLEEATKFFNSLMNPRYWRIKRMKL